jgi:chromate reductase
MFVLARNPSHLELCPTTQLRLLGLSGSLRRASYSTAVLRGLQEALAPKAQLDIFSLHGLPLYNEDEDGEHAPESVRALRSAVETTDGVIMVSPEYNHGMSGVLKNSLDWAPPALWMFCAEGQAGTDDDGLARGVCAQQQMNETLASILARPVLRPQIVIGAVHEKVSDGRLADEATLHFALAGVDDLLEEISCALFERRHEVTMLFRSYPGGASPLMWPTRGAATLLRFPFRYPNTHSKFRDSELILLR